MIHRVGQLDPRPERAPALCAVANEAGDLDLARPQEGEIEAADLTGAAKEKDLSACSPSDKV